MFDPHLLTHQRPLPPQEVVLAEELALELTDDVDKFLVNIHLQIHYFKQSSFLIFRFANVMGEHRLVEFSAKKQDRRNRIFGPLNNLNFVVVDSDGQKLVLVPRDDFVVVSHHEIQVYHTNHFHIWIQKPYF